jgi:predicted transcriptional regulator
VSERGIQGLALAPRRRKALLHLAGNPHASNRQIAAAIGIKDEAQISRLLSRMRDLGLVHNVRLGQDRGGPNAWRLTADGRRLADALKGAELAP